MTRTIRCFRTALVVAAAILAVSTAAVAQNHTTGLPTTKTCPAIAPSNTTYDCTFTVTNADNQHGVANLAVTDAVNGGTAAAVDCLQSGSPVTALGAAGSGNESCGGTVTITAAINCTGENFFNGDLISASGVDADTGTFGGLPVSGSASNNTVTPPLDCGDGNACTNDTCSTVDGCHNDAISCDDSNACTTDTCDTVLGCQHAAVSCNDNNACTTDTCDTVAGCQHAAVSCDDGNACTTDTCDTVAGCQHAAVSCDDGLFCTDDSCDATAGCQHAAHVCDDQDICTDDSCNEDLNRCDFALDETNDPSCVSGAPGRMTGGGSIFTKAGGRVTHGFELHCDPEVGPNNLEINFSGNHCHLTELLTAVCTDDPTIAPRPPSADFDTYNGTGTMTCNSDPSCTITFTLTDAGEPGKKDFASYDIVCPDSGLALSVSGNLNKGNQQAHKN